MVAAGRFELQTKGSRYEEPKRRGPLDSFSNRDYTSQRTFESTQLFTESLKVQSKVEVHNTANFGTLVHKHSDAFLRKTTLDHHQNIRSSTHPFSTVYYPMLWNYRYKNVKRKKKGFRSRISFLLTLAPVEEVPMTY